MSKMKKKVLELGGKLYYSDTDSIVTDIQLPKKMVDKKKNNRKIEKRIFYLKRLFYFSKT